MSRSVDALPVGRVAGLWRYPVKSMGAEALNRARVDWHGFEGDRRWAFIRNNKVPSGFPWLTLREVPGMNRYVPSFVNPDQPDTSPTVVRTPDGQVLDVTDPALGATLSAGGAQVIRQARGVFDTFPLSLITTQTVDQLSSRVGTTLDVQRFRPNILIEAAKDVPFPEDDWVGRVLSFGDVRMRVDKRDGRCVVITIDPLTAERTPAILKTVVEEREGCLGVYGTTVRPGDTAVGDVVLLHAPAT